LAGLAASASHWLPVKLSQLQRVGSVASDSLQELACYHIHSDRPVQKTQSRAFPSSATLDMSEQHASAVDIYGSLQSARDFYCQTLSLGVVELPSILFSATSSIGRVDAPVISSLQSLSVRFRATRVIPCRSEHCILSPQASDASCSTLAALASISKVDAILISDDTTPSESGLPEESPRVPGVVLTPPLELLPLTYEPSADHGGVLICFRVPAFAPEGSRVVIVRVTVGGCELPLGEAPLEAIVGFNHAPAPEGPLYDSAQKGDARAVLRLLEGGASTEEKDWVSGGWQGSELTQEALGGGAPPPPPGGGGGGGAGGGGGGAGPGGGGGWPGSFLTK
jgi:hypothetical protein